MVPPGLKPHRDDRFPHALKNSSALFPPLVVGYARSSPVSDNPAPNAGGAGYSTAPKTQRCGILDQHDRDIDECKSPPA